MGKAVIFSLASLLIVILFVASSSLTTKFRISESEIEVTRTRVKILNSVVNDFENNYFEKMLYISSKNALVGLSQYYSENGFDSGVMTKSLQLALNDVIYDGILYNNKGDFQANLSKELGQISNYNSRYTLLKLITNISGLMDKFGLEMTEFNLSISPTDGIKQLDPWTIQVRGEIAYFISDKEGIASWKGFTTKTVNVSVIGLYVYDYESGHGSNKGIITGAWKRDNGTWTEPPVVDKLSNSPVVFGKGICLSYCENS